MTTRTISGQLDTKRIVDFMKKVNKVQPLNSERCDEHTALITHGYAIFRVHPTNEFCQLFLPAGMKKVYIPLLTKNPLAPHESNLDIQAGWEKWSPPNDPTVAELKLTWHLYEVPGAKTGGTFYRNFIYGYCDTDIWIEKTMMDVLSPDLDALKGFIFELATSGNVRVYAINGMVAILRPNHRLKVDL